MISNYKKIVLNIIGDKKDKVYKLEQRLNEIERKLDKGELNASQAMANLRGICRYNISSDEYRKIEKELQYRIK